MTPHELLAMPVGELAVVAPEILCQLKSEAADFLASAQAVNQHLDLVLERRYVEDVLNLQDPVRLNSNIVSFEDGDVLVTIECPVVVTWDQTLLADMARRIAEAGDDPREFIDIHFSISQDKFNAFKPALRKSFAAARSQKAGQPTFHLNLTPEQ